MTVCTKDHSGIPKAVANLEESQAGEFRHRCAGCAYEKGKADQANLEETQRARIKKLQEEVEGLKKQLGK